MTKMMDAELAPQEFYFLKERARKIKLLMSQEQV